MNRIFLIFGISVALLYITQHSFAAPSISLPLNINDLTNVGSGTLTTTRNVGQFYDYNITDGELTVLMVKFDILSEPTPFNDSPGFGAIQLFNGASQIYINYVAASEQWYPSSGVVNSWYDVDNTLLTDYGIVNPADNGNNNFYGEMNDNYLTDIGFGSDPREPLGETFYYYVGFENAVYVTDVKLGNGSNRVVDYNITFFADYTPDENLVIPEPMTILLLCAGILGTALRKRLRR